MRLDSSRDEEVYFVEIPEAIGYYALLLAILKDYSASKALRVIRKGD